MDFPLDLTNPFVRGEEEFREHLYLLLVNAFGTFLQDHNYGARYDIHTQTDDDVIRFGIEETVNQIPNLSLVDYSIKRESIGKYNIFLKVNYKGTFKDYSFAMTE